MRVLVTGTGYLGTALTEALLRDPDVTGVTTVGRRPHARPVASSVRFVQRDLNEGVDDLLSGPSGPIDVAIHTAWVVDPWHDRAAQRRSNVEATRRFIEACERAQVRQLLFVSSDSVYGAHPGHDGRSLTESEPPKAWHHYQYSREKLEAERMFEELAARRPDMLVQIVRPVTIWGPHVSNFISRMMTNPVIFTALGHDPLIQVIHEEDAAAALVAIIHSRSRGVVNLAGPGDMRLSAVCRRIGRPRIPLPLPLLVLGAQIAWRARLGFVTQAPGEFVYFFAHPPQVDTARLRDEIGFRPRHDFEGALTSWLRARGSSPAS